jgi:hypothetical protein
VRAYRRNYDEGALQGFVTETGLNFIVSLDYNRFKNVFRKRNRNGNNGKVNPGNKAVDSSTTNTVTRAASR